MNALDYILLAVIGVAVVLAVWHMARRRGKGCGGCAGCCADCPKCKDGSKSGEKNSSLH